LQCLLMRLNFLTNFADLLCPFITEDACHSVVTQNLFCCTTLKRIFSL
jgi:hypothetical protein